MYQIINFIFCQIQSAAFWFQILMAGSGKQISVKKIIFGLWNWPTMHVYEGPYQMIHIDQSFVTHQQENVNIVPVIDVLGSKHRQSFQASDVFNMHAPCGLFWIRHTLDTWHWAWFRCPPQICMLIRTDWACGMVSVSDSYAIGVIDRFESHWPCFPQLKTFFPGFSL